MNNKVHVLEIANSQPATPQVEIVREQRVALLRGDELPPDPVGRCNLADALHYAAGQGQGIRFIGESGASQTLSYAELERQAQQVAMALLTVSDRLPQAVILQLSELPDMVVAAWAGWLAGIPVVPLAVASQVDNRESHDHKLAAVLATLNDVVVIGDHHKQDLLQHVAKQAGHTHLEVRSLSALQQLTDVMELPRVAPEQPALYLLTSGSTSAPKLVVQSHGNILNRSRASQIVNHFTVDDCSLNWLPLDHVGGIVMFHLQDIVTGCQQIQVSTEYVLQDPLRWLDLCSEHQVTLTWAPNFAFELINSKSKQLASRHWKLDKLRFILNGGESIVARQAHQFIQHMQPFGLPATAMTPSWGMSETCSGVTFSLHFSECRADAPFVPVGEPIPGISLRIVDEQGKVAFCGQEGHLQITGCSVFSGYLGTESDTSPFSADGWFNTGDLALITEQGVAIVGRDKDVLIVNGRNIAFHEIEACINALPGVDPTNSCVFTQRDERERLCIVITTSLEQESLNTLLSTIRTTVREKFSVSVDRIWRLLPEQISKTSIGKIQRKKIQKTITDSTINPLWESAPMAENHLVNYCFRRLWQPLAATETSATVQRILLFCDQPRYLSELENAFVGTGVEVLPVQINDSGSPHEWAEVLQAQLNSAAPLDHFLYFTNNHSELAEEDQAITLLTPLNALLQAWSHNRWSLPLMVVTLNGQYIPHVDQLVDPVNSVVTSLLRSANEEIPRFHGRAVDIPCIDQTAVHSLLAELRSTTSDIEIAWRDEVRYVSRLARLNMAVSNTGSTLNHKYVLVGGLGGAGVVLAERLAQDPHAHIWLIGRTSVENMGAESLMKLARLKALSAHIHYRVADVTDYTAIADVIAQIQAAEGGDIGRIYQLAGHFSQRLINEIHPVSDFALLDSKVQGSRHLYRIAKALSVPSLVLFSSANGYFSGTGVALYAAANRYQEALAEQAHREAHVHVTSIGWSMLKETGLSKGFVHQALTEAKGYLVLEPQQAIALLEPIIASGEHACVVGINPAAPAMSAQFWLTSPVQAPDETENTLPGSVADNATDAGEQTVEVVAETLAMIWQELLDLDELGWDENLFDLGANSLLLPQVILRIEQELGFKPALVDLFQYPDVASLAEFVSRRLSPGLADQPGKVAEQQLQAFWQQTLDIDDLSPDENVFDLGANSLLLPQLQHFIETQLRKKVSLVHLFQYPTVASLADFLHEQPS